MSNSTSSCYSHLPIHLFFTSQGTCQGTLPLAEPSPNLTRTIDHLPGEVLLEIFDFYRQSIESYNWRGEYVWFNLTQVCRKWRAVAFASTSRLDLGIIVGPTKPVHIETFLSTGGLLPIFIKYLVGEEITSGAVGRMRTALEQHDRVREISFVVHGTSAWLDEFFCSINYPFPVLESLTVCSKNGYEEMKLPDTFLRGPDLSNLRLRRLLLEGFSLTSTSRFLLSLSTLTALSLNIDTAFGISPETSLLACLQGMPRLCRIHLVTPSSLLTSPPPHSALTDIVPLLKLTYLRYSGHSVFMDAIAAGLSAPSLRNPCMVFHDEISSPIVHLPRFISETEVHYHAVHVILRDWTLRIWSYTQSEYTGQRSRCCWLSSKFPKVPTRSIESMMQMSGILSKKLSTVEELRVVFGIGMTVAEDQIPWRRFYQQFPSIKLFQASGINYDSFARTLLQDDLKHVAIFPALEEIELVGEERRPDSEAASRSGSELAAFEPFISSRQKAGRPVKVYISKSFPTPLMDFGHTY